jgi:hypothetical protein
MTALNHSTRTDSLLRLAMRIDGILTGVTGVAGLPLAGWLAEASGTTVAFEKEMAVFYIVFGALAVGLSTLSSLRVPGMIQIIVNVLYTVGAVALVVAGIFPLTALGVVLVLASGVYTLAFAELQYVGWRRAFA